MPGSSAPVPERTLQLGLNLLLRGQEQLLGQQETVVLETSRTSWPACLCEGSSPRHDPALVSGAAYAGLRAGVRQAQGRNAALRTSCGNRPVEGGLGWSKGVKDNSHMWSPHKGTDT